MNLQAQPSMPTGFAASLLTCRELLEVCAFCGEIRAAHDPYTGRCRSDAGWTFLGTGRFESRDTET